MRRMVEFNCTSTRLVWAERDQTGAQSLDFTHSIDFLWSCLKHQIWKLWTAVKDCSSVTYQAHYWNSALKNVLLLCDIIFCCTQLSLLVKVFFILYCTTFMVNKDEYIYCVEWPIEWSFSITQHVNDLDDTTWTPKYLTFSHQTISRLSEVSKLLHGCLYREPNLVQTDFLALIAISKDCSSDWQTFISQETLAF